MKPKRWRPVAQSLFEQCGALQFLSVQFPFINVQTKHDELNMLLHVLFGKLQR